MQDRDLIISQIRQRLEILYQMIEELESGGGGEPGSTNYNDLSNKPSINSITLTGNKTTTQLGLASATQINQTNTTVSNLSAEVDDIFTPDNITLNDGGFFPQIAMDWIQLHRPISVNDDIYYCIEETGVDYLYASIPTSGAFPSASYLRIMKSNRKVEFHNTIIETTPTANSDNLVTSGGIKTALDAKANTSALNTLRTEVATKVTLGDVFGPGEALTSGTDLNDITDEGTYYTTSISVTGSLVNSPFTANRIKLLVFRISTDSESSIRCTQILLPQSSSIGFFIRHCVNGTWANWIQYSDVVAAVSGLGTNITENADLNNYTDPGVYQCATTSISATLVNSPVSTTNTFRMEVKTLNASNRLMQIIYPLSGSDIFMRKYTSAGWQPWNKLTWEVVS